MSGAAERKWGLLVSRRSVGGLPKTEKTTVRKSYKAKPNDHPAWNPRDHARSKQNNENMDERSVVVFAKMRRKWWEVNVVIVTEREEKIRDVGAESGVRCNCGCEA